MDPAEEYFCYAPQLDHGRTLLINDFHKLAMTQKLKIINCLSEKCIKSGGRIVREGALFWAR